MKKPPLAGEHYQPPNPPIIREVIVIDDDRLLVVDMAGLYWQWTKIRRRTYLCSRGVMHKRYWRTLWSQGRDDYVACNHEMESPITLPKLAALVDITQENA